MSSKTQRMRPYGEIEDHETLHQIVTHGTRMKSRRDGDCGALTCGARPCETRVASQLSLFAWTNERTVPAWMDSLMVLSPI